MPQRLVYFNGEFIPEKEARISIFDSALMYGDMVFEMTRSFNQKPYRLRDHLGRLYASLRYVEIDCGLTIDEMETATLQTIEHNLAALEGFDFQIMHDVTRGGMALYETIVKEGTAPIVSINVIPLVRHNGGMAQKYKSGVHYVVTPQQSVPARYIDPKAKNRSRIYYKVAEMQAARMEKGAMALLTDERGFITEGTGNNFFVARGGEIYTPKGHDILRGVSRQACIEIARTLGIAVHEADIEPYDVRAADEAWFTSTTVCMVPCTRAGLGEVLTLLNATRSGSGRLPRCLLRCFLCGGPTGDFFLSGLLRCGFLLAFGRGALSGGFCLSRLLCCRFLLGLAD